jgi:hypothetical protein
MGEKFFISLIIFGAVLFMIMGWLGNDVYRHYSNKRVLNGLWIGYGNYTNAKDIADKRDTLGMWVCVNVKGMDYETCVETSKHECGHEIFAKMCEDGEKCFKIAKELEKNGTN